jgi:hypothetical protein
MMFFGRCLGSKARALVSWISALLEGNPDSSLSLFLPYDDIIRSQQSLTQKRTSPEPNDVGTLISDVYPPEL